MARAKGAESSGDKGVGEWKKVIASFPAEKAPRRELVRVLKNAQSWAQLADALKDEEAKATPDPMEKANVFIELAETYARLNNDNQVISSLSQAVHHDPHNEEAFKRLRSLGCDHVQGYWFGRSMDAGRFRDWLTTSPWSRTARRQPALAPAS